LVRFGQRADAAFIAALAADSLAKVCDFLAVGSNDLTMSSPPGTGRSR